MRATPGSAQLRATLSRPGRASRSRSGRSAAWTLIFACAVAGACAPAEEAGSLPRDAQAGAAPDAAAPGADPAATAPSAAPDRAGHEVVLFLGTSLTAGYGLDPDLAFPALIQAEIDRAGLPFRVVNAGLSGETSAGGLRRLDWSLRDRVAALVLELGANDGLRGLQTRQMEDNLTTIIQRTRERWPDATIVLAGMEAPPNLGTDYVSAFREVFPRIAREQNALLIPFLLEDVAGIPSLNLDDRIHPNPDGHRIIARTVWKTLHPALLERIPRASSR